jgi:hypothetical protein
VGAQEKGAKKPRMERVVHQQLMSTSEQRHNGRTDARHSHGIQHAATPQLSDERHPLQAVRHALGVGLQAPHVVWVRLANDAQQRSQLRAATARQQPQSRLYCGASAKAGRAQDVAGQLSLQRTETGRTR